MYTVLYSYEYCTVGIFEELVRYGTVQYCNKLCAAPRDADDQQQYNNTSYIVYEYEYEKCNIILCNP